MRMKPFAIVGVLLIVLGVAALVYQGVTYTSRETRHRYRSCACDGRIENERCRCHRWSGLRRWLAAWRCSSPACARARSAASMPR